GDAQGPDVTNRIDPQLATLRAKLPLGYRIEIGGAYEDSAKGQQSIAAGAPLLLFAVLTLLMIQLQSFARTAMVILTAPLGLIGVTRSDFFGPMAVAMMGGLVVATALTLIFLPALYALWFRVRRAPADAEPVAA